MFPKTTRSYLDREGALRPMVEVDCLAPASRLGLPPPCGEGGRQAGRGLYPLARSRNYKPPC
ncbi:Hypothetical protein, partial CDS, partial [Neorhizobium galegae bv. orientalis]